MVIGCLDRATRTAHLFSAPTSKEGIECSKAKEHMYKSVGKVYPSCEERYGSSLFAAEVHYLLSLRELYKWILGFDGKCLYNGV